MKTLSKDFTINFANVPNQFWSNPKSIFASLGPRLLTGPLALYMALARYDLVYSFRDYVPCNVNVKIKKPEIIENLISQSSIHDANFIRAYVDWRLGYKVDFDFRVEDVTKAISMLSYIDSCLTFSY